MPCAIHRYALYTKPEEIQFAHWQYNNAQKCATWHFENKPVGPRLWKSAPFYEYFVNQNADINGKDYEITIYTYHRQWVSHFGEI